MSDRDLHGAALDQVLELTMLLGQDMDQALRQLGLTPSRTHLLWELQRRGASTQRVLADALQVTPRNITGLVDGLVATGFVTREPHPTDRRATLVTLTAHGAEVTRGLVAGRAQLAELLFADMPGHQLAGLREGLTAVISRLRANLPATGTGQR